MTTDQSPFTAHEIISRVDAPGFGSWVLMRRVAPGILDSDHWVRVTAADGYLTLVGDLGPMVFAHGPRDPLACVRWIGCKSPDDTYYPTQKAAIGMGGREHVSKYDVEFAREELRRLLAEAQAERRAEFEDLDYVSRTADKPSRYERALQAGLDVDTYDGLPGITQIVDAVSAVDGDVLEAVADIGRRTRPEVRLAVQALNRLVELLDAEASATEAA
jgi:hypothetical protein